MKKLILVTAATLALTAGTASAQTSTTTQRNPIADIFGAVFGDRLGVTTSIESQWAAGQTPLANQRAQFESRVDGEVSTGALNEATGTRLKYDYYQLVQLEARYGADRRYTTAERTELADRYGALTQVLADRAYADAGVATTTEVADGRAEFNSRVDAALAARHINRAQARRLKSDYEAVARVESGYLRDGMLSSAERADLDTRLDAISRALTNNRLSTNVRAQLQVEYEDLARLESAYARLNESTEEQAYLERRLAELETRARVGLGASGF